MALPALGGLVLAYHNELCDELADLATHAFNPSAVHDETCPYPPLSHCTPLIPLAPATSASSVPPTPLNNNHGSFLCGL